MTTSISKSLAKGLEKATLLLLLLLSIHQVALAQVSDYAYSKQVRINNAEVASGNNLANFPVLFKVTADQFRSTANGGLIEYPNGYLDLIFTSQDSSTVYNYELESYDPTTGEIVAWVNVPSVTPDSDTFFRVFYGNPLISSDQSNPIATWNNDYGMVQHLQDGLVDATDNNNDASYDGSLAAMGQVQGAREFDGTDNSYAQIPRSSSLEPSTAMTLSMWVYVNSGGFSNSPDLVTKGNNQQDYSSYLNSDGTVTFNFQGSSFWGGAQTYSVTSNQALNQNQWYYLTFTKQFFGGPQILINGALDNTGPGGFVWSIDYGNNPLYVSAPDQNNFSPFNGRIDEVRLSNTRRPTNWISTEFNNQSNPDAFLDLINDPPKLSNIEGSAQDYKTEANPVAITSSLSINDIDGNTISSATIAITNNYNAAQDVLDFTDQNGIAHSWDNTAGVLTLSGEATVSEYQAAVRSVTYVNTSSSPSTGNRTVSFTVSDPEDASNTVSREINIIPPNDPPVLSNIETSNLDYTEGDGKVAITSSVNISDSDNTNLDSARVIISGNYTQGEDELAFANTANITSSWDVGSGVLTLAGTASISDYQNALQSVTYNNVSAIPSTAIRTVEFTVHDSEDPSNTLGRDISITQTNNIPTLSNIEESRLQVNGDDPPTKISTSITVEDPDNQNIQSATIQISNNYISAEDELSFSDILGISGSWDSSTGTLTLSGSASKDDYQTALRSVSYDNTASTPNPQTRTVSFTIDDGSDTSNPATREIALSAVRSISGLQLWLKGDAGVITNSSNEVTNWEDQSGNNRDFSSSASTRPTFASNISSLNNQAAIDFAGDGDFLEDADGEGYINGRSSFTLFYVIQSDQTNTDRGFFDTENPNTTDDRMAIRYDAQGAQGGATNLIKAGILDDQNQNKLESFSDIQTTQGQILSLDWDSGNEYNLVVDGVLNNPSAAQQPPTGTLNNASTVIVGKGPKDAPDTPGRSWDGYIAEVILYDRFLPLEERQAVEDYLSKKYNISIRLIGKATGGENISADTYASGTYTSLDGPRLREDFRGELQQGDTIVFKAPDGFEWDTGGSNPSVTTRAAYGDDPSNTNLSISFDTRSPSEITFTINSESDGTGKPGEAIFSGLRIRPTQGTLPNSGTITNSGTTGPGGTTNYGDIVMVPGNADSLIYVQPPTNNPVNQSISPSLEVQIVDQFGNKIEQAGSSVAISKSAGTGTLSGTTNRTTNINGTVYFDDLSFDQTGTKRLTVSSSGLPSNESAPFDINNPDALAKFEIEKVSGGIIPPQTAGVPFEIKITAMDGTGSVDSDFNGQVEITSNAILEQGAGTTAEFSNGVLSSHTISINNTGEFTITATNADGPEDGSSNSFEVNPGSASINMSTIAANPTYIANDGSSTSAITVQLKDSEGNDLESGGAAVTLSSNAGSLSSVTDNGDGTYTATLTSSTNNEDAIITGTLNSETIQDNAKVTFTQFDAIWEGSLGGDPPAERWSNGANWNTGNVPQPGDAVLVPTNPAVGNRFPIVQQANQTIGILVIEDEADVTVGGDQTLTVSGTLTGGGEVNGSNSSTLEVGGDLTISQLQLGNVVMNGSGSMQHIENIQQFVNLEIDNPNNVLVNDNILVTGTLVLTNGNLIIPSGKNIIANNQSVASGALTFRRRLTGVRGWRMISSPVVSTYDDFLDGTLTQGYSGASYDADVAPNDTLQPNVLWYVEDYQGTDNQRWRTPSSASQSLTPGRGLFVYIFGDIQNDDRYNQQLPDTLEVTGPENTGNGSEIDFNVTYTDIADSIDVPDTGWNLVGNPYGATINWDNNSTWTKTNINQTIYVWDPNANGGKGNFLTWNGNVGSLGSGLLAPFQGFWVKANAPNPVLKVSKQNKTIDGIFVRKESNSSIVPKIKLKLEAKNIRGIQQELFVMFGDNAKRGFDEQDGYRMFPFGDDFLELYSRNEHGAQMSIENLPKDFEYRYELPIEIGGIVNSNAYKGPMTLSWPEMQALPNDWIIKLRDNKLKKEINLRSNSFYSFDDETSQAKAQAYKKVNAEPGSPIVLSDPMPSKKKSQRKSQAKYSNLYDTRFTLVITTEEIESNIPQEFQLSQNYPNPFNPSTKIEFGLPEQSRVSIEIYDILGRRVARLADQQIYPAGFHTLTWSPNQLASGVYLYRVRTQDRAITKKLTYIK